MPQPPQLPRPATAQRRQRSPRSARAGRGRPPSCRRQTWRLPATTPARRCGQGNGCCCLPPCPPVRCCPPFKSICPFPLISAGPGHPQGGPALPLDGPPAPRARLAPLVCQRRRPAAHPRNQGGPAPRWSHAAAAVWCGEQCWGAAIELQASALPSALCRMRCAAATARSIVLCSRPAPRSSPSWPLPPPPPRLTQFLAGW